MPLTNPTEYTATVVTKQRLSSNVFFLQVQPEKPVGFVAGQHMSFPAGNSRRPFSMASTPEAPILDFLVSYTPDGATRHFIEPLQRGDTTSFQGPTGYFQLAQTSRPLVFIATGTGIAPIRAMIHAALAHRLPQNIMLFFANHDAERLYFHTKFESLAAQHSNFTYTPIISRPTKTWVGQTGLVTTIVPQHITNPKEPMYYICGNPHMVVDMIHVLSALHVPIEHIKSEQYY